MLAGWGLMIFWRQRMRCEYCHNKWTMRELEPGRKCPTCGATVSDKLSREEVELLCMDVQLRSHMSATAAALANNPKWGRA